MPDLGGHTERVAEVEERLGRKLAASVREWVAFAADVEVEDYPSFLFYTQSGYNIDVGRLPGYDGYTIARCDSDGGLAHQLVREADARRHDPPLTLVTGLIDEGHDPPVCHYTASGTNDAGDRVSTFALGQALTWLRGEGQYFGHVPDAGSEPFLARMREEFPAHVRFFGQEVFEAPELLVTLSRSTYPGPGWQMHARARRPSPAAQKAVPGVFWDFVTTTAKREGPDSTYSSFNVRGFHSRYTEGGRRRAAPRVVFVDG